MEADQIAELGSVPPETRWVFDSRVLKVHALAVRHILHTSLALLGAMLVLICLAIAVNISGVQISGEIDSGIAALVGASIGAGATLLITILQLRHSRNQSLFDAKRACYAEALGLIRKATVWVHQGKSYPKDADLSEQAIFFNRMAALALLSGKEVNDIRSEFNFAYPEDVVIADPIKRVDSYNELLEISRRLRSAMRKELSIDN